jgi:hypothetical protein
MADQDTERQSAQQETPGGRSSRGPEYGIAGEPLADTMPYDAERGENTGEGAEGVRKAFDASNAPAPDPAPPVSKEEQTGMSATDMDPEPPLGVGESRGGRAEDLAPDRPDVGTKGADRPVGKVAGDDSDSVGAQGPRDPESPDLQTGDQGG